MKLRLILLIIFCLFTGGWRLDEMREDMKVTIQKETQPMKILVPAKTQDSPNQQAMKGLLSEAKKGNVEAQWRLGILLMSYYLPEYDKAAFYWFFQSARASITAAYLLAECYYNGIGTSVDYPIAFEIFSDLAKTNRHALSKLKLAQMYYFGQGTPVDKIQSKAMFSELAKGGMPLAKTWVAILFKDLDSPEEGYDEASYSKDWIEIAAEKGDSQAARLKDILKAPEQE